MPTVHRRTVLVVEDEPLIAMMIVDMLEDLGHTVSASAQDVDQAMAALADEKIDLALLDVNLGSGTSLAIAEHCFSRDLGVIFLTGYQAADLPEACKGRPVLTKPFTLEELQAVLPQFPDPGVRRGASSDPQLPT